MAKRTRLSIAIVLLAGCTEVASEPQPLPAAPFGIAGTACFAQGTPIATPRGDVPIEQILIGDRVLAYDFDRRAVVSAVVTAGFAHGPEPLMQLATPSGTTLHVTPNHPVYVADTARFQPAGEIGASAQTLVLTSLESAAPLRIQRIESAPPEIAPVYDLTVAGLHNYFAAGVLVHNKEQCWIDAYGCNSCYDSDSCRRDQLPPVSGGAGPLPTPTANPPVPVDPQRRPAPRTATEDAGAEDAGS